MTTQNADLIKLITQLLGTGQLPAQSSNQGAWGAYESDINGDQLRQLQELMGYTPPPLAFIGGPNLLGNGGYIPLAGTSGGIRAEQAGADGNYRLAYTPNAEGTNMALHQSDIAGSKNTDMLGTMFVGGILGAGLAPELSSLFSGGNMSQAEMMKLMADFEGAGGGLTAAEGAAGGLSFEGLPMEGDSLWNTLNTGAQGSEELVEGVNAFSYNGQLIPYGEVGLNAAPGFSMSGGSGLTSLLGSLGIDASGLTGADIAMLGKVGLLGGGLLGASGLIGSGSIGSGGSSGGGGSYTDAANATAEQNLLNMLVASGLNHPNQSNPYGSSTWTQDPTTGQWTNSTQFSPGQQALYDQSTQGNLLAGGLANQALTANANKIVNPIDFSALPAAPVSPGTTAYAAMMSRLNPQIEADRSSQATALANSGLDIGGKAYSEAMRLSGQRENDLRLQAASAAIPLDEAARKNALQEQTLASQLPLSNINALRTGGQPTMPNFGQTWTPSSQTQGADLLSALGMQSSYNLGQQNLATATNNANKQGLFGLGSSLLGSDSFWNWFS